MYLPAPRRVQVVHEEPRAAMVARIDTPLGPLSVANTHLSFVPGWNRVQLRRLIRDLRGFPGPRVLMGDLNMTPQTPGRWTRMRSLGEAPTFPADAPSRQLDHILTEGPEQERMEAWIVNEVNNGASLPGLYPMNAETKARYAASKK